MITAVKRGLVGMEIMMLIIIIMNIISITVIAIMSLWNCKQLLVSITPQRTVSRQLVLSERDEIISAGNFHGEYPAKACDYLAIGIHEIASMSERRIERLVNPGQCVHFVKRGLVSIYSYTACDEISHPF